MKIYQIHEIGGEWEDSFDYIVGTYIHKENAQKKVQLLRKELEEIKKQSERCRMCDPLTMERKPCFKNDEGECENETTWSTLDTSEYTLEEVDTDD